MVGLLRSRVARKRRDTNIGTIHSFSLYFVSRRFSRCSATEVHMYAGLILGYNTVCGERYLWLSTELVWWVVLRFRLTKLRLVAVKLHQTMNIDINSPSHYSLFAINAILFVNHGNHCALLSLSNEKAINWIKYLKGSSWIFFFC